MDKRRQQGMMNTSHQKLKQNLAKTKISDFSTLNTYGPGKGLSKRSGLQKSKSNHDFSPPIHKGHYLLSQDKEDQQENRTMESFSPRLTRARLQVDSSVRNWNQYEEEHFQEEHELEVDSLQTEIDTTNPQRHENNSSTSHGSRKARKESKGVTGTKKRRLNKEKLVFEVNECARIVGPDSQLFITKGGCIMREHAKFDGTTWKKQENSLKEDIIAKCTKLSLRNIKNRSFNEVPHAVSTVSIAREVDIKRRQGEELSKIDNYKIAHFSKRKNKMVNEKADEILNDLRTEEAMSSCTPAEICMKKLHRIPGYRKGGSISTKENLATSNLRVALEREKAKSEALEEKVRLINEGHLHFQEEQIRFQEEQNKFRDKQIQFQEEQVKIQEDHSIMKEQMGIMMKHLLRLAKLQAKKVGPEDYNGR